MDNFWQTIYIVFIRFHSNEVCGAENPRSLPHVELGRGGALAENREVSRSGLSEGEAGRFS